MGQRVLDKAFHFVQRGNRKKLRLLLRKHPVLRTSTDAMLIGTAMSANRGMIKWLLENRVSPNAPMGDGGSTPLMIAAAAGDITIMQLLLDYGADMDALSDSNENALGFAVTWGQIQAVEMLAANGVDLNNLDDSGPGKTQLDWAELSGWDEMAAVLRRLGAKRFSELEV